MAKINLQYVVIGVIIVAFLLALKKTGSKDNYYRYGSYVKGGNGDDCIIRNGVMVCREKGVFPSWFYPSYYNYPYYGYGHGYPYYGYGGYGYGYGGRRRGRRGGRRRRH